MDKPSRNSLTSSALAGIAARFLFFQRALNCIIGCQDLYQSFLSFFQPRVKYCALANFCSETSNSALEGIAAGFLFFNRVLNCIIGCQDLYQSFLSLFQPQVKFCALKANFCSETSKCKERIKNVSVSSQQFCFNEKGDVEMRREDVEMVMGKLGFSSDPEDEKLEKCINSDDLSVMFDEKEPSLVELKKAFCVFDANGDGFIDPRELQRVLCNLGFREGLNVNACKQMITAYDKNGDGRIAFNEFVEFMENIFC